VSLLMRATEVVKRPVVTLAGDDVAQIKDIVYEGTGGSVAGFTLSGRGVFSGPMKTALAWSSVLACGPDAVMVASADVLVERDSVVGRSDAKDRDVLGSRVMSTAGKDLGKVVDVIIEVGELADVVGYEIESSVSINRDGRRVLIPLPDTLAVSGEALMVPEEALEFIADDLSGFGAAVEEFRARLRGDG